EQAVNGYLDAYGKYTKLEHAIQISQLREYDALFQGVLNYKWTNYRLWRALGHRGQRYNLWMNQSTSHRGNKNELPLSENTTQHSASRHGAGPSTHNSSNVAQTLIPTP